MAFMASPREPKAPLWWLMRRASATPDYLLRSAGVRQPPVDVFSLARALDIRLEAREMEDAGVLENGPEGAVIAYRKKDPWVRQRFTVAHEIGHLMKHELITQYRERAFDGTTQAEIEANGFAADLLVPMWMLDPYAMNSSMDTKKLASVFGVSTDSMGWRLRKWAGAR